MSIVYSVFVNKDISMIELAKEMAEILGKKPELVENMDLMEPVRFKVLGLDIRLLTSQDYENNTDLRLAEFDYQIYVDYFPNEFNDIYADPFQRLFSVVLGNMLTKRLSCETLILRNADDRIETFSPNSC